MALAAALDSRLVAGVGGGTIDGRRYVAYRLKLARGSLEEARQDADLGRWRSPVDSVRLALENAGENVLALFGSVGRTHNPATQIRRLLGEDRLDAAVSERLERLAALGELLGPDMHIHTDYGDEAEGARPGNSSMRMDAREALAIAVDAVSLADRVAGEGQA